MEKWQICVFPDGNCRPVIYKSEGLQKHKFTNAFNDISCNFCLLRHKAENEMRV